MRSIIVWLVVIYYLETTTAIITKLDDTVDLTWPFNNDTIYWTSTRPFSFTKKIAEVRQDGVWYAANEFCAGEHGGTHFDAPYHFNSHGWKVGEIPLSHLIVRGIMIDLTDETEQLKDQALLLPEHLEKWRQKHGSLPENCVILVRFGWAKHYENKFLYLGIDNQSNLNFPGVSPAAAEWIAKSGKVVGVGVDTASVDPGKETNYHAHRTLSENQIYVLENVKIPPIFPETGFVLYVMPMYIQEGTGAPLRLIAIPFETGIIPPNLAAPKTPFYGHIIVIVSSVILYVLYLPTFSVE